MKKLVALAAVAAALGFINTANAADMATKAPVYKAPYAPPAYNWTGFYLGINGGYARASRDVIVFTVDDPCCVSPKGWFGGGQIGYNYQIGTWLLGVEADFQGADISKTVNDVNFGDTMHSRVDWFGTLRGRLGYVFDPMLIYVTGGLAYGHVNNSVVGPILVGTPYNIDRTKAGYAIGGGVEYRLAPSWSVKAEYQYINLGKNAPTNPAGLAFDQLGPPVTSVNDNDFHTVRLGLNWHFGGP